MASSMFLSYKPYGADCEDVAGSHHCVHLENKQPQRKLISWDDLRGQKLDGLLFPFAVDFKITVADNSEWIKESCRRKAPRLSFHIRHDPTAPLSGRLSPQLIQGKCCVNKCNGEKKAALTFAFLLLRTVQAWSVFFFFNSFFCMNEILLFQSTLRKVFWQWIPEVVQEFIGWYRFFESWLNILIWGNGQ